MGYCMDQVDSSFLLKEENQRAAYKAVKEQMSDKSYSWVSAGWFKGLRDIYAVLEEWGYQPKLSEETGDIIDLTFSGEKIGQELELFNVIAPFVEKGSFLEMSGEEGSVWRWVFDGTTCKEVYPKVSWEE